MGTESQQNISTKPIYEKSSLIIYSNPKDNYLHQAILKPLNILDQ